MTRYGYILASEEHSPTDLVRQAKLAEEAGFDGLWISDHFHPWLDEQGHSGFVWSIAVSQAYGSIRCRTSRHRFTCRVSVRRRSR